MRPGREETSPQSRDEDKAAGGAKMPVSSQGSKRKSCHPQLHSARQQELMAGPEIQTSSQKFLCSCSHTVNSDALRSK